jgi:hypothetical protein
MQVMLKMDMQIFSATGKLPIDCQSAKVETFPWYVGSDKSDNAVCHWICMMTVIVDSGRHMVRSGKTHVVESPSDRTLIQIHLICQAREQKRPQNPCVMRDSRIGSVNGTIPRFSPQM